MPRAWACVGERSSTTSPPTFITPASGWWIPARIFTSVLLPAPFSPTSACTSPGNRLKSTPRKACTPLKYLAIPPSSTMGSGGFVISPPLCQNLTGHILYSTITEELNRFNCSKKYVALSGGEQSKLSFTFEQFIPFPPTNVETPAN